MFITAKEALGLTPGECIVFEDAEAGISAAHAAGISTVGIGTREILKEADYVVKGLYEMVG